MEKLLQLSGSKYVLAAALAKRAKAINTGAKVLIDDIGAKADLIAAQELLESKIHIRINAPAPEPTPAATAE